MKKTKLFQNDEEIEKYNKKHNRAYQDQLRREEELKKLNEEKLLMLQGKLFTYKLDSFFY